MSRTFNNPVVNGAPDPWMLKHTDGFYYFMMTLRDRLELWRSQSMTEISDGDKKVIWMPTGGDYGFYLWAPELHRIQDCWYVYYTANDGGRDETRRVCVLRNKSDNPMEGNWEWIGPLMTERAGLDGTVMELRGELYFLYAGYGHFPQYGSAIYIVRMEDPYTLKGDEVMLTAPTLEWEQQGGMAINEGPVILQRNGQIFLVYSASTTWSEDYCLGMLTMQLSEDPMVPHSWSKSPTPVFRKSEENRIYATGHNCFTVSPDGQEDWIVYHALPYPGADVKLRSMYLQKFDWHPNGAPHFGEPLAEDIRFPSGG